ncbi:MAG: DUF3379 family protein [Gammaproteobacteria bacterium]|nr:DUF3379 family protein [Gammaproteobacteria bacterium]
MNCLDFRRRWLTTPGERDMELARHERACASCRQFARRGSQFERKLANAVAIEVPASLAERIHRRRDFSERVRQRQVRPLRYALIASGLLILCLALLLFYEFLAPQSAGIEVQQSLALKAPDAAASRSTALTFLTAADARPTARI